MFWSPGHSSQSVPLFSQDPVIFLLIIVGIRYSFELEAFEEKCDIVRQVEYMSPFTPNMGNNWKLPTVTTCLNAKFRVYRSRQSSWWKKFAKLFSFVLLKQHKWLNLTIIKTQNWTKAIWNLLNYIYTWGRTHLLTFTEDKAFLLCVMTQQKEPKMTDYDTTAYQRQVTSA